MTADLAAHATQTIQAGSKSFAVAARLFAPETRRSAVLLYAWCRYCDDVVDGQQLGFAQTDQAEQPGQNGPPEQDPETPGRRQRDLAELQQALDRAYAGNAMSNPAFAAFQDVALRHRIPERYPREHLAGFAMDVHDRHYETLDDTLEYCYHVAGVVGVMMALIMGVEDEPTLDRACDLGMAFQLTNIARDIVEDAGIGRCYLPAQWLREADIPVTALADIRHRVALAGLAGRLVELAEPYYRSAQGGLAALPLRSAWAIATALGVYREIGVRVSARGAGAWDSRISTGKLDKLRLLVRGLGLAISSRGRTPLPRPDSLWQRPRHQPRRHRCEAGHRAARATDA